jgi:hypothetical protein
MKSMRRGMLSMAVLLIAGAAAAQEVHSAPIDLAVTYDGLHSNHITAQSFWMQGSVSPVVTSLGTPDSRAKQLVRRLDDSRRVTRGFHCGVVKRVVKIG